MDEKLFNELLSSIKEAGQVMRGERKPEKFHKFQSLNAKVCKLHKQQVSHDKKK